MKDQRAEEFLRSHGMHPDGIDMQKCCEAFQREMRLGLHGQPSSLMMIPTYVTPEEQVPKNVPVAVLDAGGTNLRCGICRFTENGAELEQLRCMSMPGIQGKVTAEEFLQKIAELTEPLIKNARHMGFCFSFPAEITSDLDGILLEFNKEVDVEGAEGIHLCAALCEKLQSMGHEALTYALINDTVAALLGGYGATDPSGWDGYIGFILGTGTNCCYTERTDSITKLRGSFGHTMVVNMEAGGYGQFPTGDFDKTVDARSNNPGQHLYEKMVAGGYFGEIAMETVKGALGEGILRGSLPEKLEMKDICAFLDDPDAPNPITWKTEEPDTLYTLLDLLLERAAKMIAVCLTAILLQGDMGKTAVCPACIVVEGSTFLKAPVYQEKIQFYMRSLATECYGRHFRFRSFPDNNLKGAAAAALLKDTAAAKIAL